MIKSLRLRIQLWHAVILSLVLAAFGFVFYQQLTRTTFDQIDADLIADARILEGAMQTMSASELRTSMGELSLELPRSFRRHPGPPRDGDRFDRKERRRPDQHPPPKPYFVIFDSTGQILDANGAGAIEFHRPSDRISFRGADGRREVWLRGPHDSLIVVGRDIDRAIARLSSSLTRMFATGIGVLALGLAGGWWLSGKAIEPINRISQTATGISSRNLSDRVDTTSMDNELQSLATTLNAMLSRLEQSFDQQSRFTADASHELRTPIAVILSQCELALRRPRSSDDYQQTIATCQKAGDRMKGLVESLLTLARADSGLIHLNRTNVDLNALAVETQSLLQPFASEREIEISVTGSAAVASVDTDRIGQVITNLVHNAIAYNVNRGSVTIETTMVGDDAIVRVCDTGVGIPTDAMEHLFDRFYRVDESRSRAVGGNGLGLAICKSIVDAHGGTLTAVSKPGEGSTFEVRLPRLH